LDCMTVAFRQTDPVTTMPPEVPLRLEVQDLSRPYRHAGAPGLRADLRVVERLFVFAGAPLVSLGFVWLLAAWLAEGGFTLAELALCALVGFSNAVIAFYALTALIGMVPALGRRAPGGSLDIALLLLTYNEPPLPVFARPRWRRGARSCSWPRRPPARTSRRPRTCSSSAASRASCRCSSCPTAP
jgi:hypothetical protein